MSNTADVKALEAPSIGKRLSHWKQQIALYYQLTKPGIIMANAMTAAAGYVFAVHWHLHIVPLAALVTGTSLIIASACVWNNYIDRDIDKLMVRTSRRAIPSGKVRGWQAWPYASILGTICFAALAFTNRITVLIGIAALVSYVIFYGFAKRHTEYGTLVGTIPGAASLVAGYTTVAGRLDSGALLLFLIMLAWQMPHFYAIAIRRHDEYAAAGLPVWPVKRGILSAKRHIILFIILFIAANCLLTVFGYTGYVFAVVMGAMGVRWLQLSYRGFKAVDTTVWAKQTFLFSLATLLVLCIMLPLGVLLP
jgi:protoheme IX farnesyltransferase